MAVEPTRWSMGELFAASSGALHVCGEDGTNERCAFHRDVRVCSHCWCNACVDGEPERRHDSPCSEWCANDAKATCL